MGAPADEVDIEIVVVDTGMDAVVYDRNLVVDTAAAVEDAVLDIPVGWVVVVVVMMIVVVVPNVNAMDAKSGTSASYPVVEGVVEVETGHGRAASLSHLRADPPSLNWDSHLDQAWRMWCVAVGDREEGKNYSFEVEGWAAQNGTCCEDLVEDRLLEQSVFGKTPI